MTTQSDDHDDNQKDGASTGFWASFFDALSWVFLWTTFFGE